MPKSIARPAVTKKTASLAITAETGASRWRGPKPVVPFAPGEKRRTRTLKFPKLTANDGAGLVFGYVRDVELKLDAYDDGKGTFEITWTDDVTSWHVEPGATIRFHLLQNKKSLNAVVSPGFFRKCGRTPRKLRGDISAAIADAADDITWTGRGDFSSCR